MKRGRVAFVFWEGYLGIAPSLVNAARLLAQHGFGVDVIMRRNPTSPAPPILPPEVRCIEFLPCSQFLSCSQWTRGKRVIWRIDYYWCSLTKILDLLQLTLIAAACIKRGRCQGVFGVDTYGSIAAYVAAKLKGARFFYWSLEILLLSETRRWADALCKRLERLVSRRAEFAIIQDRDRACCLAMENGMAVERFLLVPNGPMGFLRETAFRRFHEMFNLPPQQRVVLHVGAIHDAYYSRELAAAAACWPKNYSLVLHEKDRRSEAEPYLQRVAQAGKGRVLFSLNPVSLDELDKVVCSGDVGVVFYRTDLGPNWSLLATASGKFAFYLQSGLPVVCLDMPGFREVVEMYGCGICVKDFSQVTEALEKIFTNYEFYRANALRCYRERYEFSKYFEQVIAAIEQPK